MSLRLHIDSLSSDGRGIARSDNEKVVFVQGALPGETVQAELVREQKTFCEAKVVACLEPSPQTVDAVCPHAADCGGCPLMRLPYEQQLVWKERFVAEAMQRIGGLDDLPLQPVLASPCTLSYRNRVELAFGLDENRDIVLGMRRPGSHTVVPTPTCRLVPEHAWPVIRAVVELACAEKLSVYTPPRDERSGRGGPRRKGASQGHKDGLLRFCQLRFGRIPDAESLTQASHVPDKEGMWLILLTGPASARERASLQNMASRLLQDFPGIHAVVHEERQSRDMLVRGEKRVLVAERFDNGGIDASLMILPLAGQGYLLDATDFFQVNLAAAEHIVRTARGFCREEPCLDLFCGVGAPTLSLPTGDIEGLEYSTSSVAMARRNARRFGRKAVYESGDCARLLARSSWQAKAVPQLLCDPPRGGLGREITAYICQKSPQSLVYVSCNPATLARDIRDLGTMYRLECVQPIDLFPHTAHVETVCHLIRK